MKNAGTPAGVYRHWSSRPAHRAIRPAQCAGPVAAVTHGGITSDLPRGLLRDDALLDAGIRRCAVTVVDDLKAVMIASTAHLA
jgi:hypothetical protein